MVDSVPKDGVPNFKIVDTSESEDEFVVANRCDVIGKLDNFMSLEEVHDGGNAGDGDRRHVLYDKVVAEDISSDEQLDKM